MRVLAGLAIVATTIAVAAPPPKAKAVTWADWTGSYRGTLSWSACTVPGAKTVALGLDFTDAVASIDLAPARAGLPALTLVNDEHGWSARQGDVAVAIARPKPDALDVAIDFDSGCTVRGRLTRSVAAVPACATLVGWAQIEARCTKVSTKLEDPAKLATATWKPGDAAACGARADKLALALIDAGCAPHPDPTIGWRSRVCAKMAQDSAKLARCANVPQDAKNGMATMVDALTSAAQTATTATLQYVEKECLDADSMIESIAINAKCPL